MTLAARPASRPPSAKRIAERKAKGILTEAEKFEMAAAGEEKVDPQTKQMQEAMQGFDPAAHQKERLAHLEGMRGLKVTASDRF